jgi:serine phosphatase RsbU (regulator of sigma subunit)
MPLGAMTRFPYCQATLRLAPGDTVLLMSDGFPERLDPADEMLGYERASSEFSAAAAAEPSGPAAVIEQLRRVAEDWAAGRTLEDDMTFVVLKVRDGSALVAS